MTDKNEQEILKIEIPVEEEETVHRVEEVDIAAELRKVGKQLAQTLQSAWESEERQRIEGEIREGVKHFSEEINKAFQEIKSGTAAQKVRTEASELGSKLDEVDLSNKARNSLAQGLSWLSEELARLAEKFTPTEKSPDDIDDGADY